MKMTLQMCIQPQLGVLRTVLTQDAPSLHLACIQSLLPCQQVSTPACKCSVDSAEGISGHGHARRVGTQSKPVGSNFMVTHRTGAATTEGMHGVARRVGSAD